MNMLRFWKIFWIDSTSAETIELSLQEISGEPEAQVSGVDHSAESVLRWLSHVEHDWLLIFDNEERTPPSDQLQKLVLLVRRKFPVSSAQWFRS